MRMRCSARASSSRWTLSRNPSASIASALSCSRTPDNSSLRSRAAFCKSSRRCCAAATDRPTCARTVVIAWTTASATSRSRARLSRLSTAARRPCRSDSASASSAAARSLTAAVRSSTVRIANRASTSEARAASAAVCNSICLSGPVSSSGADSMLANRARNSTTAASSASRACLAAVSASSRRSASAVADRAVCPNCPSCSATAASWASDS